MCRLSAITSKDIHPVMRTVLFNTMILHNLSDATPQRDGWGVSDGTHVFKGASAYNTYDPTDWMDKFFSDSIWIGHLRNASNYTSLTQAAAHPYKFTHFIGAHNGVFYGTEEALEEKDIQDPVNTDSWRAFRQLDNMLKQGETLDSLLDDWLSLYKENSAFALLMLHNHQLHVVRGPATRDLYYASFAGGMLINTSKLVLQVMGRTAQWLTGEEIGEIKEFPALHYGVCAYGENDFNTIRKVQYTPKSHYVTTSFQSASYKPATIRTAADRQDFGNWIRFSSVGESIPVEVYDKLRLWKRFHQECYPMREQLLYIYASELLGKSVTCFEDITLEELTKLFDLTRSDPMKMNAQHRKMLDLWNDKVDQEDEPWVFYMTFEGFSPFWRFDNAEALIKEICVLPKKEEAA